jgi:4-alpha-glucanotransferase
MRRDLSSGRHAGLLVPLFSAPSRESWGIGELSDLPRLARWMADAGCSFLQLLPLNEMADGQQSPYSALSAMAIDPIFIAPSRMEDLDALGGEAVLTGREREALAAARGAATVDYEAVRPIKVRAFRLAFERFVREAWARDTARAGALRAFIEREAWWLDEYCLFRALHAREEGRYWREWPAPLRDRDPAALEEARASLTRERLFFAWLQWIAAGQWADARGQSPVGVLGDFPFMVSGDSADVWSRQQDFRLDASVGAPPDAFSETGQDWGFPAYRWPEIAAGGDQWLRERARRSAALYDGFRVDHLVGFFRTYSREPDGSAAFHPGDEPSQAAQGRRLLELFKASGARIIAEDLGVIPDFVRATLRDLDVPGFKVLRWEREWDAPGQPFHDPAGYAAASIAASGTHDTESLAEWWDGAPPDERGALCRVPALAAAGCSPESGYSAAVRDAIVAALYGAGSDLVLLPVQDVFGWRDRINRPAVISGDNWNWRLPWPVEDLPAAAEAQARAAFLGELAARTGRA